MNNKILEVKNLGFTAGDKNILKNISFDLEEKDFLILIGSNGCGKSSLLKCINQTYRHTRGKIMFLQKDLEECSRSDRAQVMTTFTQNIYQMLFKELSVIENCILYQTRFFNESFGSIKNSDYTYYKNYLANFDPKIADNLDSKTECLSGGQQQQLALALCLEFPPKLLILDEHTSALDPKTSELVMDFTYQKIMQNNITCIMTTHNIEQIKKFGNRILALKNGEIIFNKKKHLLDNQEFDDLIKASY